VSQAKADSGILDRLLGAIGDVLGGDVRDASVNFLDLDGDSLSAIIVIETLREESLSLNVEDLLSTRPLSEVACLVEVAK
jgi:hypothetical protein